MNSVEQFQEKAKEQSDAAIASANSVAASVQAITAAHADFTKKALQDGSDFITKLANLKAPGDVMALQSEYAKTTHEAFVGGSENNFGALCRPCQADLQAVWGVGRNNGAFSAIREYPNSRLRARLQGLGFSNFKSSCGIDLQYLAATHHNGSRCPRATRDDLPRRQKSN